MNQKSTLFSHLAKQSLFFVWGPPSYGPRSRVFSKELGIGEPHFVNSVFQRGAMSAPLRYGHQAIKTLFLLFRLRPKIVFFQSPPSQAGIFVYLYCLLTNSRYVVDAHSDALQRDRWTRPRWLYKFLARNAAATIVTNEHFQQMISGWGGDAFVLRDIPTTFPEAGPYRVNGEFNVVMVNTFAKDEPLAEVLAAARGLDGVQFHVTGKLSSANSQLVANSPGNVHFTDFLPNESYYALLSSCQAVMCLTTRDHTMQRGACEALSLGKPIITSDWPILRNYFRRGTVHVDNSADGIRQGILEMKQNHDRYQRGIRDLQSDQRQEWQEKVAQLVELVDRSLAKPQERVGTRIAKRLGAR